MSDGVGSLPDYCGYMLQDWSYQDWEGGGEGALEGGHGDEPIAKRQRSEDPHLAAVTTISGR